MIFFTGLFVAACCVFAVAVRHLVRARKSHNWPVVAATIIDASVSQGGKGARANIRYRYVVAGRPYTGDRIVVGWMWDVSGGSVEKLVARHPQGSSVHVAVDPELPAYSVLTPGVNVHQIFSVVVCSLVLSASTAALVLIASSAVTDERTTPDGSSAASPVAAISSVFGNATRRTLRAPVDDA